ncbi:alcohol dehydrogenase catalytic domain-containing protein [Candidatus Curtissbacteria bacterium]|nr:alcohol dehydrogenase catalytic domain-containing protein [Candidatus Curtissbacteria bacterium]
MNAVVLTTVGMPGNLCYTQIPIPEPKQDEALVQVEYCGLNHLDLLIRQGKRPGPKTFPHILGSEIVGTIAKNNGAISGFRLGDRVTVYPWTFCSKCKQCTSGNENICNSGGTMGRTEWGGYAEYVRVRIQNLIKIPKGLRSEIVCAATLGATTAYHLINRAQIKPRCTVLITGATGGVGTVAIQLLKAKQCIVICTTSHSSKIVKLKRLGVDSVVSTKTFLREIKKLYPQGVDYVIDIMGGFIWSTSVETLAKNGTMVFCATTLNESGIINIGNAFARQLNIMGSYGGTKRNLQTVLNLLHRGTISPIIDSIFSLKEAARALKRLEHQNVFGKILLRVISGNFCW